MEYKKLILDSDSAIANRIKYYLKECREAIKEEAPKLVWESFMEVFLRYFIGLW